ncbi:LacI family transcriptional regulator (plasmid) [Mesorhizobium sp. AR07]|uniref:LacI family DNA-binding transcriptional regulator n=1 Tax=Mesorhizobium sp. AR07 TaxID=2865838 RepID=UPI00215DE587|nr:LacI family DNA-binding transcriptional regulator [Mesorhizobium sp. AR07]UVK49376.1 LacI family transcriptional regulator [Mesorhizobium sp. AR07]
MNSRDRLPTATIYDVARHAQVSAATVSRVVNGLKVREDLAERVHASVSELGYRPSRMAQRMRTSTSHLWALIVPDFENTFFTRLARGLEHVCRPSDTCVFIGNSDDDPEKERHYLDVALAERVGGVVIAPSSDATDLSDLAAAGIPVVIVDRAVPGRAYDTVLTDNLAGGSLAANHLKAAGYRKVVCIAGPPNPTSGARLHGFISNASRSDLLVIQEVRHGNNRVDGGYNVMRQLLEHRIDFDAVFVTNNLMAVGAIKALDDFAPGRRDSIGFVGFDLNEIPLLAGKHIASIDQDPHEMGRLAGERILLQQRNESVPGNVIELMPSLATLRWHL